MGLRLRVPPARGWGVLCAEAQLQSVSEPAADSSRVPHSSPNQRPGGRPLLGFRGGPGPASPAASRAPGVSRGMGDVAGSGAAAARRCGRIIGTRIGASTHGRAACARSWASSACGDCRPGQSSCTLAQCKCRPGHPSCTLPQCKCRPSQSSCTLANAGAGQVIHHAPCPDAGAGPVSHHAPRSDAGTLRRLCKAWCRWPPCPPPCTERARAGARAPVAGRARAGPLQLRLPELKQREEDRRHDRRLRDARALRAGRMRCQAPAARCVAPLQAPDTERSAVRAQHQEQSCLAWPASSTAGLKGADTVPAPPPLLRLPGWQLLSGGSPASTAGLHGAHHAARPS